jgi:NADPH:quinone reductase-like Zn-dependent oxidoreductase
MTAAVLTGHGDLEVLEVRDDVAVPNPAPGQVLVQVAAAGVNNTDIWSREGAYGSPGDPMAVAGWRGVPLVFPRIQGADIAGYVVEVGKGVDAGRVGQRVVVDPALYDRDDDHANPVELVGSEYDGGFAEFVAVDAAQVHAVDESPLRDEQLACLPIAFGTAMGMLERVALASDDRVLVTGASGGVGLALVELAAARAATVLALTSESKQQAVHEAGATATVLRSDPDLPAAIQRAAGGPLDVIADVVGGAVFSMAFPLLREGGRLVIAGAVAGAVVSFDLRVLYLHQRRLIGSSMHTPTHFRQLVDLARRGAVSPLIANAYPLTAIHQAQRDFANKRYAGKLVLRP